MHYLFAMIPEPLSVFGSPLSGNSLLLNISTTVENIAIIYQFESLLYKQKVALFEGPMDSYLSVLASKFIGT